MRKYPFKKWIEPEEFKELVRLVSLNDPSVTSLNLRGAFFGDGGAVELAGALAQNTTIQRIDLAGNYISKIGLIPLLDALSGKTTVIDLNLSHNYFTEEAKDIAENWLEAQNKKRRTLGFPILEITALTQPWTDTCRQERSDLPPNHTSLSKPGRVR